MFFRKGSKVTRPKNSQDSKEFLLEPQIGQFVVEGSFKLVVKCPEYLDHEEWIVSHIFDFYSHTMLFNDVVSDLCTTKECPTFTAGDDEFFWLDLQKKPIKASAPEHIQLASAWIQKQFDDESIFPTKYGTPFSKDTIPNSKILVKYILRILMHIYYNHYSRILSHNSEAHLNSLFAHIICFGLEYDLLDLKEINPMKEFIDYIKENKIIN
eukprot:NODE_65_length_23997_cov_0.327601.p12 type:complete len:211 gc:universal NODE_65_length_23997_cov_0.327601:6478-7110(+)